MSQLSHAQQLEYAQEQEQRLAKERLLKQYDLDQANFAAELNGLEKALNAKEKLETGVVANKKTKRPKKARLSRNLDD